MRSDLALQSVIHSIETLHVLAEFQSVFYVLDDIGNFDIHELLHGIIHILLIQRNADITSESGDDYYEKNHEYRIYDLGGFLFHCISSFV